MKKEKIIIYCDGGARGNPGPAAAAFVVLKGSTVVYKGSEYLGKQTNNFAEYTAVNLALQWLKNNNSRVVASNIKIVVDSQLVRNQLEGNYKVKSKTLLPLYKSAKEKRESLDLMVSFEWSPRDGNKIADYLVNEELDKNL